jgi:hypothetical protein
VQFVVEHIEIDVFRIGIRENRFAQMMNRFTKPHSAPKHGRCFSRQSATFSEEDFSFGSGQQFHMQSPRHNVEINLQLVVAYGCAIGRQVVTRAHGVYEIQK